MLKFAEESVPQIEDPHCPLPTQKQPRSHPSPRNNKGSKISHHFYENPPPLGATSPAHHPEEMSAELASPGTLHLLKPTAVFTHPKGIFELKLRHHPQATATAKLALLPRSELNEGQEPGAPFQSRQGWPGPPSPAGGAVCSASEGCLKPEAAEGRKRAQPVLFGARISGKMRKDWCPVTGGRAPRSGPLAGPAEMEDSIQAAGPRGRRAAPGQQRQWPAERRSPGPLQEGLCNLPGAGSRAGAPQEVETPGLPCAAPPATCHPASTCPLPMF